MTAKALSKSSASIPVLGTEQNRNKNKKVDPRHSRADLAFLRISDPASAKLILTSRFRLLRFLLHPVFLIHVCKGCQDVDTPFDDFGIGFCGLALFLFLLCAPESCLRSCVPSDHSSPATLATHTSSLPKGRAMESKPESERHVQNSKRSRLDPLV
jgi:hypothetical protein